MHAGMGLHVIGEVRCGIAYLLVMAFRDFYESLDHLFQPVYLTLQGTYSTLVFTVWVHVRARIQ